MGQRGAFGVAALLLGVWNAPAPAAAELYRCTGSDGRVVFTDKPAACPGSEPHVPVGVVQSVPSAPSARPAASAGPAAALERQAQEAQESVWRDKKRQAEEELAEVEARQAYLDQFLTHCSRRGTLLRKDEAGLQQKVSCQDVYQESESLETREAELRRYLTAGIQEECRKAGCLPGWIR